MRSSTADNPNLKNCDVAVQIVVLNSFINKLCLYVDKRVWRRKL